MIEETQKASVPVFTKAQHLIASMLTITKGYVQALLFAVKKTFSFWSHMELWCFELQIRHNLLLQESKVDHYLSLFIFGISVSPPSQ